MPLRAQIILMAVEDRKELVENMIPVLLDSAEQRFIGIFCELGRSGILGAI